ncbi:MAG: ATP synthase F1, alpha subunit, partial [Parcubacteria group bacterium GW2011_GWA2_47_12]
MQSIIKKIEAEIAAWSPKGGTEEVGIVRATGDGIAEIDGLTKAVMSEMVLFDPTFDRTLVEALKDPSPIYGLILNLEEDG